MTPRDPPGRIFVRHGPPHVRQAFARAPELFANGNRELLARSVPDWPFERGVGQGTKREQIYLLSAAN